MTRNEFYKKVQRMDVSMENYKLPWEPQNKPLNDGIYELKYERGVWRVVGFERGRETIVTREKNEFDNESDALDLIYTLLTCNLPPLPVRKNLWDYFF